MFLKFWHSNPVARAEAFSSPFHCNSWSLLKSIEIILYLALFLSTRRILCVALKKPISLHQASLKGVFLRQRIGQGWEKQYQNIIWGVFSKYLFSSQLSFWPLPGILKLLVMRKEACEFLKKLPGKYLILYTPLSLV